MKNNGKMHSKDDFKARKTNRGSEKSALVPFALGTVIGGIVGATFALLYAPAEGSEVRRGMSETLDDLVDGAKEILKTAKTSTEKLFSEGLGPEEDGQDDPLERTRERADDIIEDADRTIAEARRRSTSGGRVRNHEEDEDDE